MQRQAILVPRAGFPAVRDTVLTDNIRFETRDGLGIAVVQVRKGRTDALAQRLHACFGIELPRAPKRAALGDLAFLGTGPGTWLATREQGGNAFADSLIEAIGDRASVVDQSDAFAFLRMAGHSVRDTLALLVPVDLHPRTFKIDDVAVTLAGHFGVTLWRLEDQADRSPMFELAIARSFAGSFWHVLSESASWW